MKKLLTSIVVLITATAICHSYSELDANTSVESFDLKKEIISTSALEAVTKNA